MSAEGTYWAGKVRGCGPTKKAILFALGEAHNHERDDCFPSQAYLAEQSEMSERSVRAHLKEMEGVLFEKSTTWWSGKKVTNYILFFDVTDFAAAQEEAASDADPDLLSHADKAENPAGLSTGDEPATSRRFKPADSTDKPESDVAQTGNCLPDNKGKERESRKRASARGTRRSGPTSRTRDSRGAGAKPSLTLDDVATPRGLEDFGRAIAARIGVVKANSYLSSARFVSHPEDGIPKVIVSATWATRIEDAGRDFLKAKGWKVKAA